MLLLLVMPTRDRPNLLRTALASVAQLSQPDGWTVQVAVVVNAASATALRNVAAIVGEQVGPYPACVVEAPTPGPAFARNRGLEAAGDAGADAIFFMDDDQTAPPDLLRVTTQVMGAERADVVMPRLAWRLEEPARNRDWIDPPPKQGDAAPRSRNLTFARSGGVLFSRRLWEEFGLRFSTAHPFAGGEDIDFFSRAHGRGAQIVATRETYITEFCPVEKQSTLWLLRFEFRRGNIEALYRLKKRSGARLLTEGSLKAAWYALATALCLWSGKRRWRCAARAMRGAGEVAGALGRAPTYYRETVGS